MAEKRTVLAAAEEASENASLLAAIREAEEDFRQGRTIPHEEVKKLLVSWSAK